MCTVTFLPSQDGFVLTHNRDEAPSRSPQMIARVKTGAGVTLLPRDTLAGGSWIAAVQEGYTVCLLNGAFVKHVHAPPYRRSRGLVLLDFLEAPSADWFFEEYDFTGIEPFTFLYFDPDRVIELRWDGNDRFVKYLPVQQAHFWCSSTLYPADMQERRELVFREWLKTHYTLEMNPAQLKKKILHLHHTGSVNDPENDFIMNRHGRVQTVSITQVQVQPGKATMAYHDLISGQKRRQKILLC
jgi:hypothetical protein